MTDSNLAGYGINIEVATDDNTSYRKVLATSRRLQLVVMSLRPGEDIGTETHCIDQFFRIESGTGLAVLKRPSDEQGTEYQLRAGVAIIVPAGVEHNVFNTGRELLKFYTLYTGHPHEIGLIQETKPENGKEDGNHCTVS